MGSICLLKEDFQFDSQNKTKSYASCKTPWKTKRFKKLKIREGIKIYQANGNNKKSEVVIFISDKVQSSQKH